MLESKDKIITNQYGDDGSQLDQAKKRGDWDDTNSLILKGRDWFVSEIKGSEI